MNRAARSRDWCISRLHRSAGSSRYCRTFRSYLSAVIFPQLSLSDRRSVQSYCWQLSNPALQSAMHSPWLQMSPPGHVQPHPQQLFVSDPIVSVQTPLHCAFPLQGSRLNLYRRLRDEMCECGGFNRRHVRLSGNLGSNGDRDQRGYLYQV